MALTNFDLSSNQLFRVDLVGNNLENFSFLSALTALATPR